MERFMAKMVVFCLSNYMFTSSHVVRENVLGTPAIYALNPKNIVVKNR